MDEIGGVLTAYLADCAAKVNPSFESVSETTYYTRVFVDTPDKYTYVFTREILTVEDFSNGFPVTNETFLSKTTPENTGLSLALWNVSPFYPVLAQIMPFKSRMEGPVTHYEFDDQKYPNRIIWSTFDLLQIHEDYQRVYVETFPDHRFSE